MYVKMNFCRLTHGHVICNAPSSNANRVLASNLSWVTMDGLFEARARLQATLKASETAFEARRKTSAETKLVPLEATAPRTEEPCASLLSYSSPALFSPLEGFISKSKLIYKRN
jgi:hypothetical protein